MVFGYLLLILLPIAAIAYIVWDHKRKTAQRIAASAGRLNDLLGDAPAPARSSPPSSAATTVPQPTAPASDGAGSPAVRTEANPAGPLYAVRERLLSPPQTLLYYLLRAGLPDYLVFARVTLASVLEAGPGVPSHARNEQLRRLGAHTVDFVVSDRSMKPIVVVKLNSSERENAAQGEVEPVRTWLAMAGVRYIELDATALPRKDAIRAILLDESPSAEALQQSAQALN